MKKGLKITLIATGSIAAALILTIVILSSIVVRPLASFVEGDYSVTVMYSTQSPQNDRFEKGIKDKLSSVRFSVMRALLEGNSDYKIKPEVSADDNDEFKKISASRFISHAPRAGQYMLKFSYGDLNLQTFDRFKDENGDLIKFDSLILVINESNGNIQPVKLYPFIETNLTSLITDENGDPLYVPNANGEVNHLYYSVYEFDAKMYTSDLYDYIVDCGLKAGAQAS